jgi:outer membrane protein OmpA-like peptidoglycan-associated protein
MNKILVCASVLSLISACASVPDSKQKLESGKLAVVQVVAQQNAEHIFCEGDRCPKRTPKYLPAPPAPAPKPQVQAVVEQAPKQVHFKVHFRWGWSRLDAAGRKEVEKVVASGLLKDAMNIEVAGRTDPTGPRKFNEKLALNRAKTVKAGLVMAGISADRITAAAQTPCCDGDLRSAPAVMRELRRTDIDITITTK